jgi:hypothetical protein
VADQGHAAPLDERSQPLDRVRAVDCDHPPVHARDRERQRRSAARPWIVEQ